MSHNIPAIYNVWGDKSLLATEKIKTSTTITGVSLKIMLIKSL